MLIRFSLFSLLIFSYFCNAMDEAPLLIPQKRIIQAREKFDTTACVKNVSRHEHFLFIPLKDIAITFNQLHKEKQKKIQKALRNCPLFAITRLPQELQYEIISEAVNHDEYAANKFFCMPIMRAYELYDEIRKNQVTIADQEISIDRLFGSSQQIRDEVYDISKPGIFGVIAGRSDSVFDEEDYERLKALIPEEIEHSQLKVLPSMWERMLQCVKLDPCKSPARCKVLGFLLLQAVVGILTAVVDEHHHEVAKGIGIGLGAVDCLGFSALVGYEVYRCRNRIIQKARVVNDEDSEEESQSDTESTEDSDIVIIMDKSEDPGDDVVIRVSEDDEESGD